MAAAAAALGATGLIGWIVGSVELRSIVPGEATMKANTALCLVFAATAILLFRSGATRRRETVARVLGIGVTAIALASLLEYVVGASLGIDELLFADPGTAVNPGRMAPITALALLAVGVGVAAFGTRISVRTGIGVTAIGLLGIAGYATELEAYRALPGTTSISLPSALALSLLGGALIAAQPRDPLVALALGPGPAGRVLRTMVPVAVLTPLVVGTILNVGVELGLWAHGFEVLVTVAAMIAVSILALALLARSLAATDRARHKAEHELRIEKETTERILDTIHVPVVVVDVNKRVMRFNEANRELVGRPEESISLDDWVEHCQVFRTDAKTPLPADEMPVLRALAGEDVKDTEIVLDCGSKGKRHLLVSARQLRGPDGEVIGAVASQRDVTERLQAERRFQTLVDAAPDAIVIADAEGRIVLVNAETERLFGYLRGDLVGRNVEVLLPETSRLRHRDHRARYAAEPRRRPMGSEMDLKGLRKDGSEVPVEISLSPIETDEGLVVSAAIRDVTERRRNEAEIRRLAAIVDSTHDGVIATGFDGKITAWNAAAERMYGYAAAEAVGMPVEALLPADRRHELDEALERVQRGESVERPEAERVRSDGSTICVSLTTSPIYDAAGDIVGASTIARDIGKLKRAERAQLEAEARFRRAFEDSGAGMAIVSIDPDRAGRVIEANPALCELTGYAVDQLTRMDIASIGHPDDHATAADGLRRLLSGELDSFQAEHRILTATGSVRWVSLSTSIIRDPEGEPINRVVQMLDISERKRFEGQLQYLADHDALTGLFNRRRFEAELDRELDTSGRYDTGGALLSLDLDNFKYVNDSLGHAAGDELISAVGHALSHRLRASDTVGRLGGDEFAVILPHADEENAMLVARGITEMVRDAVSIEADKGPRRTTASVGVAMFPPPSEEVSAEELLAEADIAMYDAKEAGRDRVALYQPGSDRQRKMEARLTWAERIRQALAEDQFVLHAQPIIPLGDDDGAKRYELLLRMVDHDGDLIPPGTFLFVAERFGLIEEIDRWVVREAVRMLAVERRAGRRVCFAVNLSARSIQEPGMTRFIAERLAATGVDPRGLMFEVTETIAIENIDRAKQFARELRDLGCSFALDDFGSGFASFYYLKHLEFDYLKIDGEFIKQLPSSETDQLVVRSLVEIAHGLGRKTIAEFVADDETVEILRGYGVEYAQGFHLGKPQPLERADATQWAADGDDGDRGPVSADEVSPPAGT